MPWGPWTLPIATPIALCLLVGYFFGACPWGLWLGRWFRGVDVRTLGSRNLGATNVYRSLGPALGTATLILDAAKGAIPVLLVMGLRRGPMAWWAADPWSLMAVAAGLGAVLGHVFSFWIGFRGGKGVATTAGVLLALAPLAFAAFAIVFVATVALTRFISLGSTLGAIAFVVALNFQGPGLRADPRMWLGLAMTVLIVWRHRDNYRRLVRGEERRFSLRGGSAP
jgi:glycerol-3-phosphate acyltransferase PlsY